MRLEPSSDLEKKVSSSHHKINEPQKIYVKNIYYAQFVYQVLGDYMHVLMQTTQERQKTYLSIGRTKVSDQPEINQARTLLKSYYNKRNLNSWLNYVLIDNQGKSREWGYIHDKNAKIIGDHDVELIAETRTALIYKSLKPAAKKKQNSKTGKTKKRVVTPRV